MNAVYRAVLQERLREAGMPGPTGFTLGVGAKAMLKKKKNLPPLGKAEAKGAGFTMHKARPRPDAKEPTSKEFRQESRSHRGNLAENERAEKHEKQETPAEEKVEERALRLFRRKKKGSKKE